MPSFKPNRRKFLKLSVVTSGMALVLGINWSCSGQSSNRSRENEFSPNAWLRVSRDNTVTIIVAESEMGQGPYTLMPMMVAEELEVEWDSIIVERASVDPVYGYQMTGGSSSIRKGWSTLREAGAVAREILREAASRAFKIPFQQCHAQHGRVSNQQSEESLTYGELIEFVDEVEIPGQVTLKEPHEFNVIGHPLKRKDIPEKLNGSARFGIDVQLENQLFATVVHCPVLGGAVERFDSQQASKVQGVKDIFEIREGVAVVASNTWVAFDAAAKLDITWDNGGREHISTQTLRQHIMALDESDPSDIFEVGNPDISGQTTSGTIHNSEYFQPFQAHMTMEPMNCTAYFKPDGDLEIWAPTQSPSAAYDTARSITQSKLETKTRDLGYRLSSGYDESVIVNTTLLGCGLGRRLQQDYVSEVVQIAERFDRPVQLVWNRREDIQHDFYHPMSFHRMSAELGSDGIPVRWQHTIKGAGVSMHGARHSYDITSQRIQLFNTEPTIPTGPWRSVGSHYNVFAIEHFLDELAFKAGIDPVKMRLKLLKHSTRLRNVLEMVVDRVDWQGTTRGKYAYGSAVSSSFGSHVAQVVELEVLSEREQRIRRVVCAIDCGIVINPDIVKQQMEGSIIFGLSAATKPGISIRKGRVEQSNFHDYPILRMNETPEIEVIIAQNKENPGGIGEPGVPPVAPALANAVLAGTGELLYELPLRI